jgi:hypothetical protein
MDVGNPNSSADIEALGGQFNLGATDWDYRGGIDSIGDGSALLNIILLTGTWTEKNITASWELAAGFWQTYGTAVFSVHAGGGNHPNLSEFGAFIITPGEYSGSWAFVQNPATGQSGGGGGLSNAKLWTAGTGKIIDVPAEVPEPGILLLLGSGLLGLGLRNGRKTKA